MQIQINRNNSGAIKSVVVTREITDPKFYGTGNAAGESTLLYHVAKKMRAMGFDLIKKRMHKDGHLVDDMQQYLRVRKPKKDCPDKNFCLYNDHWAICGLNDDFNKGQAFLSAAPILW
jgi:hypothetical protein